MFYKTRITTDIKLCSDAIKNGEIVAFGTETVYGLGADCFNGEAVKKIFNAKGRPADNPLIVHVSGIEQAKLVALEWTKEMDALAHSFWPGPFTMIVPKHKDVPEVVCAGLDMIGIRMPASLGAVEFIKACGAPIAAPSANASRRPSPTSASHVYNDMKGKIPYILDFGESRKGIESTVYDVGTKTILRPGVVTAQDISKVVGEVHISSEKGGEAPKSPGTKYPHYCPAYKVMLFNGENGDERIEEMCKSLIDEGIKCAILDIKGNLNNMPAPVVSFDGDLDACASRLYATLLAWEGKTDVMLIGGIEKKGLGLAIMNRLEKAAKGNIIY